jgi:predicted RNA binding protein with dsRBD fold (UPF0201 family)
MIAILLSADVKATENVEKVRTALQKVCPSAQIESSRDESGTVVLRAEATGPEALSHLAKKLRDQRILQAVRQVFLKSTETGRLVFGIHRQAALMNRFHLCDLDDISGMGPIRVEISAENLADVIDYLAPPTVKGKPQFRQDLNLR